jgi:hypothetical protein
MVEPLIGFGGFFLAQLVFTSIARWVGVIYLELINQPPEVRRAQTVVPILLLHSGPWMLGLLVFLSVKVAVAPAAPWKTWLVSGFALGFALMLVTVIASWRKLVARRSQPHEG